MRRPALLLALLVLLAGCSLPFGSPSPTESPSAPTVTPDSTPDSTASFAYPTGYDETGLTDPAAAIEGYESAVCEAGSLTLAYTATIEGPNGTETVTFRRTTDFDPMRVNESLRVVYREETGTFARFVANGTAHVRERAAGANEPTWTTRRASLSTPELTETPLVAPLLRNGTIERAELTTVDGERAVRYAGTVDDASALLGVPTDTPATVRLTVTQVGVVRHARYEATVGERTVSVKISVESVGETTVTRPDWVR